MRLLRSRTRLFILPPLLVLLIALCFWYDLKRVMSTRSKSDSSFIIV